MRKFQRRGFIFGAAACLTGPALTFAEGDSALRDVVGKPLSPWRRGTLDIHHIATNSGDSTLIVAPDGTTILIDAGATGESGAAVLPARPNATRRPGEWIAGYIQRRLADTRRGSLDYVVITHLHPDHIGAVTSATPLSRSRAYRLTGVSDLADAVRIDRLIDPDYPEYGYPAFEDAAASKNYVAYVRERVARGEIVERFRVGSATQIHAQQSESQVPFEMRNLACKGAVWTGRNEDSASMFPAQEKLDPRDYPNVNAGSAALLLKFGAFKYFCGGDLTDWADAGTRTWMDALTPAATVAGPVDVAVAPHHGLFDSTGSAMVRALSARVWIISTWHASHPSITTLERLFNERLFSGPRSVYSTGLSEAADLTAHRLTSRLTSKEGHVIVRVAADGRSFRIIVTSNKDQDDTIRLVSESMQTRES